MRGKGASENGARRFLRCLVVSTSILAIFACLAGNSFAQDLDLLSNQIRMGSTEQKRNALFQVRNMRTEAASRLAIPALNDADEIVRSTAASAVIYLPKDEACQLLLPLLNEKAEFIRREAAYALGEVGSASATHPLVQLLQKDRSNIVRSAGAAATGKIGDPSAIDALAAVLKRNPRSEDEYLRRTAARSIGQIAETVRGQRRQTATPQSFLPEKYKEKITSDAATASTPAFRAAVLVLLKTAANRKETGDTRREAAYALGAIGDTSAIPFLKANINNKDNYLAEICKEALLKMPKGE